MPLNCPAYWFKDVWPTLRGREAELGMLDFIQQPGETIFVPHGWHHIVLNLDWTVAITHNFISQATAPTAYVQLKAEDPSSAHEWHRLLSQVGGSVPVVSFHPYLLDGNAIVEQRWKLKRAIRMPCCRHGRTSPR
jgi:histone arginine demethylase JMJD6